MQMSIGIDWSDRSHAICIRERDTRRILAEIVIAHTAEGVQQLEQTVSALNSSPDECVIGIETNEGLLVNYLLKAGYHVHPIPPAAVQPYRNRQRRTGAKSDQDDARLLADILCQDLELFPALLSDNPLTRQIRNTYRGREQLVRRRTQVINQLKQNLKTYFPLALELFSRLDSQIAQAFLAMFPTQAHVRNATEDDLRTFFKQQQYKRTDKLPGIMAKLQSPAIPVPAWQAEAGVRLTAALLEELAVLSKHLQHFEDRLATLLAQHPDEAIFRSLPRVNTVLAAGFIGEIGDCRPKLQDASVLQALAGTSPVTRQSGSTRRVRFRYACNKPLRNLLQQFARQSAMPRGSAWARGYLSNQLERGHTKARAYRALANRWARIIFRMWQDRTLYDESYHLQNIVQRGAQPMAVLFAGVAHSRN